MLLRCGAGRQAFRGGASFGTRTILAPTAAFSWMDFLVQQAGSGYRTNVNFQAAQPAVDFTYYCSPAGSAVNSPTNDNPADPITPRRFVTLANAHGGNIRGRLASGFSYGNVGFDGNTLTCAGVILEPWEGQQGAAPGRPVLVKRVTNLAAPWTFTTGTTYSTPHSTANTPVYDFAHLDAFGHPMKLAIAVDLASCRATPGSEFFEVGASLKHVNPIDGRNLVGDLLMQVPTSGNNFVAQRTANQKVWMKGLCFIGPVLCTQATAAMASEFWHQDCMFLGVGSNSYAALGPVKTMGIRPRGGGALQDFLNYTGNGQGNPTFLEWGTRMIRTGYDAGGTNNASTSHSSGSGVRVDCEYLAQNRPINDVNSSDTWMLGGRIFPPADGTSISVVSGSADAQDTQIHLDDVEIDVKTLHAFGGCILRCAGMDLGAFTKTGSGTIEAYTRAYG